MTDQELFEISADQQFTEARRDGSNIILAIGVGGGGSNAVRHMYEQKIDGVSFAICNTDRQALINSPVPTRVMLGTGLGAGGVVEVAAQAAEESAEKIKELFTENIKMVFVTAGMGGGTGTGAGPVVARLAREKGLLTVGIVTIPFLFEGDRKIIKALQGADEMQKYVDALLMINNERLQEIYPDLNFLNAFDKADDTLSVAARSISDIITMEGKINRDFNDVSSTLRNGGTAIISTGYGEGDNRVTKAIQDALHSPLLRNRDITTSKRLLFVLYFSPEAEHEFQMSEATQLTAFTSSIDTGVDIIYGIYPDPSMGEKVKITILASGFDASVRHPYVNVPMTDDDARATADTPVDDKSVPTPGSGDNKPAGKDNLRDRVRDQYGDDALEEQERKKARYRQVILRPDQLDDDAVISALEKSVAYNRDRRTVEEIQNMHSPAPAAPAAPSAPAAPAQHAPADASGRPTQVNFLADE